MSTIANWSGIAGLVLSIVAVIRTWIVKKQIISKFEVKQKEDSYSRLRPKILKKINDSSLYFVNANKTLAFKEAIEHIEALLEALSDIERYHPSLTLEDKKSIQHVRNYISNKNENARFSYLEIVTELNSIKSMLKEEAFVPYD